MKRQRLPRGLRTRLLLALLLTSLITLGVAATVLLSPLSERLREQSASNLRGAVLASRPEFEKAVRERQFAVPSEQLRQRTDGRVLVDDLVPYDFAYDTSTGASTRGATLVALRTLRTQTTTTDVQGDVVRIGIRLFGPKRARGRAGRRTPADRGHHRCPTGA